MTKGPRLIHRRVEWVEACIFTGVLHRHHKPPRGHRFSIGAYDGDRLCGVAIIGRPVARGLDPKTIVEVNRLTTDGTKNACSFLYGCARKGAFALGFDRIITYTLASEPGTSLKAAGWIRAAEIDGRSWSCESRPRVDDHPTEDKIRWEAYRAI